MRRAGPMDCCTSGLPKYTKRSGIRRPDYEPWPRMSLYAVVRITLQLFELIQYLINCMSCALVPYGVQNRGQFCFSQERIGFDPEELMHAIPTTEQYRISNLAIGLSRFQSIFLILRLGLRVRLWNARHPSICWYRLPPL
jgi:hypothetical protein